MSKSKILIVGGYGAVGQHIASSLGRLFRGDVIVAGRSKEKAKALASKLDQEIIPLKLDIASLNDVDLCLENVKLVVMCIDQQDVSFASHCIQRGIHYIDISANYTILSKLELLDSSAKSSGATVIVSIGLAPGITNLLAKHCKKMVPELQYSNIFVLLGLGEAHGEAAVRWALEDLNESFAVMKDGQEIPVSSMVDGKVSLFPDPYGKRTAFRTNISDQHVIPHTLDIGSVSTRMCFDSVIMTYFDVFLTKVGLSKLVKIRMVQNVLIKLLKKFRFGTDQFVVKVDSGDDETHDPLFECSLSGRGEGRCTGLVAAKIAEHTYLDSFPSGVYHIEQLMDPIEFINSLDDGSLKFQQNFRAAH